MPDSFPSLSLKNGPGSFPTTRWSLIRRAGADSESEASAALAKLCRDYWYPLYAYARRRRHSPHDAQDLTQSFIIEIIEGPLLGRADPDKGRFRSFMLSAWQNFLANEARHKGAMKRGGGQEFISIDESKIEQRYASELAAPLTPEDHFERNWALALLDRVLARLRLEYETAGRQRLFEILHPYLARAAGQAGYDELGAQLGLSQNTVAVSVHRMRKRYGELLRDEIAITVSSPEKVEEELLHLRAVLAGG